MKKYLVLVLVIAAIAGPVYARTPSDAYVRTPSGSGGTDAVDLNKTTGINKEVDGLLPVANIANGLTDAQVNGNLTISGGAIDNSPIGASIPSTGAFTTGSFSGLLTTP